MDIVLTKTVNGQLTPIDQQAIDFIGKMKIGTGVTVTIKKHRNPKFHAKYFSLLSLAFESWDPGIKEYKGMPAQKNFDRFRKDIAIAAGFHDLVVNIKNEVRAEAKSINFSSMDDDEFSSLYSATINVILARILTNYSREDLDATVEKILGYT